VAPLFHAPFRNHHKVRCTWLDPSFAVRTAVSLIPVDRLQDSEAFDPGPFRTGKGLTQRARVELVVVIGLAATTSWRTSAAGHSSIVANLYEISTDRPKNSSIQFLN
jgi:hypothetical protein